MTVTLRGRLLSVLLVLSATGSAGLVGCFLWFSRYGFDVTDEGFYLNWLSTPGLYPASTTQFGFVLHPLHDVLGGRIAWLRAVNVLIVLGLAWALAQLLITRVAVWSAPRWHTLVASAGLATVAVTNFGLGLLTPNYNTLTFQSVLLTTIGVVLAMTNHEHGGRTWPGYLVVGLGGAAAFLAKPTTALAMGVLVLVALLVGGHDRPRGLIAAAASAALAVLASAYVIDGSVRGFAARLSDGADMLTQLGGGHGLAAALTWDPFDPTRAQALVMVAIVVVVVGSAALISAAVPRIVRVLGGCTSVTVVTMIVVFTRGEPDVVLLADPFSPALLLALPMATALVVVAARLRGALDPMGRSRWTLVVLLLVLPHAYAFGTNNSYWRLAGQAGVLWVIAALVVLAPLVRRASFVGVLLPVVLTAQVLALVLVLPAAQSPYRQPGPIWAANTPTTVRDSTLVLASEPARHLRVTTAQVRGAGFAPGTPMLDLTGHSPGMLYAWGASSVAQPWSLGGYSGSLEHEELAYGRVPCGDLVRAWVMVEPEGPRAIPDTVLHSFGGDLDRDYEVRATWDAPASITAGAPARQQVLAPVRRAREAVGECRRTRGEN